MAVAPAGNETRLPFPVVSEIPIQISYVHDIFLGLSGSFKVACATPPPVAPKPEIPTVPFVSFGSGVIVGAVVVGAVDVGAVDVGAVDVGAVDVGAVDVGAVDVGAVVVGNIEEPATASNSNPFTTKILKLR